MFEKRRSAAADDDDDDDYDYDDDDDDDSILGNPMFTHIHTYTHTHIHTYTHTHIHTYTHTHIHTYTHTYIHTFIHTYIHRTHESYSNILTCAALFCFAALHISRKHNIGAVDVTVDAVYYRDTLPILKLSWFKLVGLIWSQVT